MAFFPLHLWTPSTPGQAHLAPCGPGSQARDGSEDSPAVGTLPSSRGSLVALMGRRQEVGRGSGHGGRSDSEPRHGEAVTDEAQGPAICRLLWFSPLCFSSFSLKTASSRQPSLLTSLIHNKYLL